jgi:hypothetical protein
MDTKDLKKVLSNIDNKTYLEKFELWKRLLSEIECEVKTFTPIPTSQTPPLITHLRTSESKPTFTLNS